MRTFTAPILFALLLTAAGCSAEGLVENIANQALENEGVSIDLEGDGITVEGPDGTVTAGQGLPANFPADFPLPPGADVQGGASGAGQDVVAAFLIEGSVADAVAFFDAELPAAGYAIDSTVGGDNGQVYSVTGNGWTGQVAVGDSVTTSLTVSLNRLE